MVPQNYLKEISQITKPGKDGQQNTTPSAPAIKISSAFLSLFLLIERKIPSSNNATSETLEIFIYEVALFKEITL